MHLYKTWCNGVLILGLTLTYIRNKLQKMYKETLSGHHIMSCSVVGEKAVSIRDVTHDLEKVLVLMN